MVLGVEGLRAQFKKASINAEREVKAALERYLKRLVADMNRLKPLPEIMIDWRWGPAPAGAVTIGRAATGAGETLVATVYAVARTSEYPGGHTGVPLWFEFGTAERVQKTTGRRTGRIVAQPYFWPTIRSHRRSFRAAIRRAVRKGIAQAVK